MNFLHRSKTKSRV